MTFEEAMVIEKWRSLRDTKQIADEMKVHESWVYHVVACEQNRIATLRRIEGQLR